MWDISMGQLVQSFDHHQEFVLGLDFSLFEDNLMASGSWDRTVCTWNHEIGPPPPCPPGFAQPAPKSAPPAGGRPGVGGPNAINQNRNPGIKVN